MAHIQEALFSLLKSLDLLTLCVALPEFASIPSIPIYHFTYYILQYTHLDLQHCLPQVDVVKDTAEIHFARKIVHNAKEVPLEAC